MQNINTTNIVFEGSSVDDFETTIGVVNPTGDRTINLADSSGHLFLFLHLTHLLLMYLLKILINFQG